MKSMTVTGRHIMVAAAVIALLCSCYWLYECIIGQEEWVSFSLTAAVGLLLLFFAGRRNVSEK